MHRVRFRDPAGSVRTGEWTDGGVSFGGRHYSLDEVDVLPPTEPSKLVCVGRNYVAHAEEFDNPVPDRPMLFFKPPSALAAHGDTVPIPGGGKRIDYEPELTAVIGEQCRNVDEEDAMDVVAGFTCANDVSDREEQNDEQNWVRGKGFDNSAPVGPTITPPGEVPDDARIECRINGEVRLEGNTEHIIFSVPELIAEITAYVTLEPGDLVLTGTPSGVGPLEDGDTVEIDIDGIPTLTHGVEVP